MTHLDLCSGIGGFALAARWCGLETVGFAEIDPYASAVLKKHWPAVPNHGDIGNVPAGLEPWLLTAGFPCQPYSIAGKRGGASDERAIWPQVLAAIERTKPRWCLLENVTGLISMGLDGCLADLASAGYSVGTIIIPACALDAPHRRDRLWILANHDSDGGRASRQATTEARTADQPKPGDREARILANASSQRRRIVGHAQRETMGGCRWPVEPRMGRVAHGIPNRVDRLKTLGNAIVPAVAAEIIEAMMGADA